MTRVRSGCLAFSIFALTACGPTPQGDGGNGDGGNNGGVDAPVNGNADARIPSDAFDPMLPDSSCGNQTEDIGLINLGDPPDMLIVLDRSGSMALAPGFPPLGASKWSIMKTALENLTQSKQMNIRFGLSYFPTDDACGVSAGVDVPIDLNQAGAIATSLGNHSPNGNTPAHFGLQEARTTYAGLPVNSAGRYVLFATDGIPNCGGSPPDVDIATDTETVAAVSGLADDGIKTFVLGFGDILGLDPQVLNDAAVAGGVPKPGGPPHFYHATNATELENALDAIAGGIIVPSCSYQLASQPPDPDLVLVTVNGTAVPRDTSHTNGWDYHPDAMTITFFGSYCSQIESGSISSVSFVYGCPGPVVN
jgi:hypothetical protein